MNQSTLILSQLKLLNKSDFALSIIVMAVLFNE